MCSSRQRRKASGVTLYPLINVWNRAANSKELPASEHLRYAMAGAMWTAARPTGCLSNGRLRKCTARMHC